MRRIALLAILCCALLVCFCGLIPAADNPAPPAGPVRLVFIHHSTGENWLVDSNGRLGIALRNNRYFVSDTNYGWGPPDQDCGYDSIGDHTDIGHWYNWFCGTHCATYLSALYKANGRNCSYSRLGKNPGGENKIILFKSCFPNSNLRGRPGDPARTGPNPLRGQDSSSQYMTVANAKGIYKDLLKYFATRPDKLFVVVTAPPLSARETSPGAANNTRALNRWLVNNWLSGYPHKNVVVFDFYNVLTSNGGSPDINDMAMVTGNHHRYWNNAVQYIQPVKRNVSAYPSDEYDSHPSLAGNRKATDEFVKILNVFYHRWQEGSD